MFFLTKFLGFFTSPFGIGILLLSAALVSGWRGVNWWGRAFTLLCLAWFLFWSAPQTMLWLGGALERDYPPVALADVKPADAIVILGGSMSSPVGKMVYPELYGAADRVWHAARLYKAGKAPLIIFTGVGEGSGAKQFLRDLGVPSKDFIWEDKSRNTVENIKFTKALCEEKKIKKALLVTSAFHMRRTMRTCELAGFDAIPAATDHEVLCFQEWSNADTGSRIKFFLPSIGAFTLNNVIAKEYVGLWAMKLKIHGRP